MKKTEMFDSLCGELMAHVKGGEQSFSKVLKGMQNVTILGVQSRCIRNTGSSLESTKTKSKKSQKSGRGAVVWPFIDAMESLITKALLEITMENVFLKVQNRVFWLKKCSFGGVKIWKFLKICF